MFLKIRKLATQDDLPQNETKLISKNSSLFGNEFSMKFRVLRSGTVKNTNHAIPDHDLRNIRKRQNRPSYNYEKFICFETKLVLSYSANGSGGIFISDLNDEKNRFQSMK